MWYFSFLSPAPVLSEEDMGKKKVHIVLSWLFFLVRLFFFSPLEKLRAMIENVYRLIQSLQNWYNRGKQSILIRKDLMHLISNVRRTLHSSREN